VLRGSSAGAGAKQRQANHCDKQSLHDFLLRHRQVVGGCRRSWPRFDHLRTRHNALPTTTAKTLLLRLEVGGELGAAPVDRESSTVIALVQAERQLFGVF